MGIGPTETKRTHSSTPGTAIPRFPVSHFGVHIKGRGFKIKMLVGTLKMQSWHQLFPLHGQQDLLQTRYTSRSHGMTNVTFDRTDGAIPFALRILLKYSR